jgi:hypothetical protein
MRGEKPLNRLRFEKDSGGSPAGWHIIFLMMLSALVLSFLPSYASSGTGKKVSSRYSVIIQKDPFDQERGGAESGESGQDAAGTGDGISENYELYGILRTGKIRKAYLKSKKRNASRARKDRRKKKKRSRPEFRIVSEGDMVDGWKIEKITATGIVLSSGDRRASMAVFSSQKSGRRATKPVAMQTRQSKPAPMPSSPVGAVTKSKKRGKVPGAPATGTAGQVKKKTAPGNPFSRTVKKKERVKKSAAPPPVTPENAPLLNPEDVTVPPLLLERHGR